MIAADVNFAAVPTGVNSLVFYIAPAGSTTIFRIAGTADTPPAVLHVVLDFWKFCGKFSSRGTRYHRSFCGIFLAYVPKLNAQGQMLLGLWGGLFIGGKDGSFTLVPMAATGACSPQSCHRM